MSAGRKSETTGTPTRAAITAPSPVCQVTASLRPRNISGLALMVERLAVAADQFCLLVKAPLGGEHGFGVEFGQQEIQSGQIARRWLCVAFMASSTAWRTAFGYGYSAWARNLNDRFAELDARGRVARVHTTR